MGASSRQALASAVTALEAAKGVTLATGEQLMTAGRAVEESAQLRTILGDPAIAASEKSALVAKIFPGLEKTAAQLLGGIVESRWSSGAELVAGIEEVGIRVTQIRDVNGTLWFVRNGEILRVGNMSQGWARVITDLAVPYDSDVEAIEERMLQVANELATAPRWRTRIVEKPELWGIESVSADAIVLRIVMKTRTTAKDDVARELRKRLKSALDDMGVALPSLSSVVLTGFDGAASVTGAHPPRTRPNPVVTTQEAKPKRRGRARDTAADGAKGNAPAPAPTRGAGGRASAGSETARHPLAITKPQQTPDSTAAPRNPSPGEHGLQSDHHDEGQP